MTDQTTHNKFTVTLKALRKHGACIAGYNKLVRHLQQRPFTEDDEARDTYIRHRHDEAIPIATILASNGLDDALWSLRAMANADNDPDLRLYAVWCARQVQHLMSDPRSIAALDVAEAYAHGRATKVELDAAWATADAADAASDASTAAWAARAARAAAWATADAAAWAAWAARATTSAAARATTSAAARATTSAAARTAQKYRLEAMLLAGKF